jgi:hypothetical protein
MTSVEALQHIAARAASLESVQVPLELQLPIRSLLSRLTDLPPGTMDVAEKTSVMQLVIPTQNTEAAARLMGRLSIVWSSIIINSI